MPQPGLHPILSHPTLWQRINLVDIETIPAHWSNDKSSKGSKQILVEQQDNSNIYPSVEPQAITVTAYLIAQFPGSG